MGAHNDQSTFPRGLAWAVDLSTTAVPIGTASVEQKVCWVELTGGAAAEIVIFRKSGGGAEHFRVNLPIGATKRLEGFTAPGGLEVLTASAAGDVGIVAAYVAA